MLLFLYCLFQQGLQTLGSSLEELWASFSLVSDNLWGSTLNFGLEVSKHKHCQSTFDDSAVMRVVNIESKVEGGSFKANDGCNAVEFEWFVIGDRDGDRDLWKQNKVYCYSNLSKHCAFQRSSLWRWIRPTSGLMALHNVDEGSHVDEGSTSRCQILNRLSGNQATFDLVVRDEYVNNWNIVPVIFSTCFILKNTELKCILAGNTKILAKTRSERVGRNQYPRPQRGIHKNTRWAGVSNPPSGSIGVVVSW